MTTLHLGVIDVPYQVGRNGKTTGDVAEILEAKYHLMEKFWNRHGPDFVDGLVAGQVQSMEAAIDGRPVRVDTRSVLSDLQHEFRRFISSQEAERVGIKGAPTKAAIKGISHRRRHPYARSNPRRPSFRDTGLYMASMRAWIT